MARRSRDGTPIEVEERPASTRDRLAAIDLDEPGALARVRRQVAAGSASPAVVDALALYERSHPL